MNSEKESNYKLPEGHVLVLRACREDMTSHGGFIWPSNGYVEAPDWNPKQQCGKGLHGWLWGEGDPIAYGEVNPWDEKSKWLCVEVEQSLIVDLNGKVKFPKGNVVFCGNRFYATQFIMRYGKEKKVIGAICSNFAQVSVSGGYGVSVSEFGGTSISGIFGRSISGIDGTSISGDYGISIAGNNGRASSGYCGSIFIRYWDDKKLCYKNLSGCIGANGLEQNVLYRVEFFDEVAKFVEY